MDFTIDVFDRKMNQILKTNITQIKSYAPKEETQEDKTIYLIVYTLQNNAQLEEEFEDENERQDKLDTLSTFDV